MYGSSLLLKNVNIVLKSVKVLAYIKNCRTFAPLIIYQLNILIMDNPIFRKDGKLKVRYQKVIKRVLSSEKIHKYYSGHCRYVKLYDSEFRAALDFASFTNSNYVLGNDALRHGRNGDYVLFQQEEVLRLFAKFPILLDYVKV